MEVDLVQDYSDWYCIQIDFRRVNQGNNGITFFYCKSIEDLIEFARYCRLFIPSTLHRWEELSKPVFTDFQRGVYSGTIDKVHIYQNKEKYRDSSIDIEENFYRGGFFLELHIYQPGTHGQYDIHDLSENLNTFPNPVLSNARSCGLGRELLSRAYNLCLLFDPDTKYETLIPCKLEKVYYHTRHGLINFPMIEDPIPFVVYKNCLDVHFTEFLDILKQFIEDYN